MAEQEPEEYEKKSYSRKDERENPWRFNDLSSSAEVQREFCFPLSEFAVYKKAAPGPNTLRFPDYVHLSNNYFQKSWAFPGLSHRRIKNVLVTMEWFNSDELQEIHDNSLQALEGLTKDQEARLRRTFQIFSESGSGELDMSGLQQMLLAADVRPQDMSEAHLEELLRLGADQSIYRAQDSCGYEQLKEMMRLKTFYRLHAGRYFVALSLSEAETVRSLLHAAQELGESVIPNSGVAVALWSADQLLDCSENFIAEDAFYQRTIAHQCLRFVDSQHDYAETQLNLLLRGVQDNEMARRASFFEEVRKCRRRSQQSWEQSKVAQIFSTPDEYVLVEHRAVIIRIGHLIRSTHLGLLDIFRAWDSDEDGNLNCSELYGGLDWLGMQLDERQLHAIFRIIDLNHDGYISYEEFVAAFGPSALSTDALLRGTKRSAGDLQRLQAAVMAGAGAVPPKTIRELYKEDAEKLVQTVPLKELEKFSAKAKKIEKFKPVWDTKGTGARNIVKVWAPDVSIGRTSGVMSFGHYAVPGNYDKPDSRENQKIPTNSLEFEESGWAVFSSTYLPGVIEQFCPYPRRYRLVWKHQQGDSPLYAWRPIPPSQYFVAMGKYRTT